MLRVKAARLELGRKNTTKVRSGRAKITMDQVNVQGFDYTAGYGGFRYGIVLCSLKTDYWIFIPLRSLGCRDAHAAFVQFRIVQKLKWKDVVVYVDVHQPLRQICLPN